MSVHPRRPRRRPRARRRFDRHVQQPTRPGPSAENNKKRSQSAVFAPAACKCSTDVSMSDHGKVAAMAGLPLEEALMGCPKPQQLREEEEKKRKKMTSAKPEPEESIRCPRCDSTNTKFCYYNNYSLSQPRYFCKGCRRYWTKGGSLRNVPVGGSCRKTKKSSSSSSSKRPTQDRVHHQLHPPFINNPANCAPLLPPLLAYDHLGGLSSPMASLQKQQQEQLLSGSNGEGGSFLRGNNNHGHGVLLDMLGTDHGLYCGYNDEEAAAVSSLPFGVGATATTVKGTANEAGDTELGEGGDCKNILGWDYWNNGGLMCSSWQSLISSSSLSYSDDRV